MHELSITRSIVAAVEQRAAGRRVLQVRLAIGALTGFEARAVQFCFDVCTVGTVLEGALLDVIEVPARGLCSACGREAVLAALDLRCACERGGPVALVAGRELLIESMEVSDV